MSEIYETIFSAFCKVIDAVENDETAEIENAYNQALGLIKGLELTTKHCKERFHDAKILLENVREGKYDGYQMRLMLEKIFKDSPYTEDEICATLTIGNSLVRYWEAVGDEKICSIWAYKATVRAFINLGYKVDYEAFCELLDEDSPVESSRMEAYRRVAKVYKVHRYETHRCVDRRDPQNSKTADELAEETAALWIQWRKNNDRSAMEALYNRYRQLNGSSYLYSSEISFLEKKDMDEFSYMVEAVRVFERWGYRKF